MTVPPTRLSSVTRVPAIQRGTDAIEFHSLLSKVTRLTLLD